jgi:glycosyltransferase involved in cell wall biosynthesis
MLAIVIPYFKLTFFEETLESLVNQTDKRFKVYIGDDASPEDPLILLEKYHSQFDFNYHRFENNLGGISLPKQWQRCIALSGNEEWIMILGDDDVLDDNVVEAFYENLTEIINKEINVVRFATKIINEILGNISDSFLHPRYESAQDSWFRKFKGKTRSSLSEHIFLRTSYVKYGFIDYPLAWHSDDRAWLDFSNNKPIYTINESRVYIRISNISISGMDENNNFKKKATIQFFKNSILKKLELFTKHQRLELLYGCEQVIKRDRKIALTEWIMLSKMYFENFNFLVIIKFGRRIFIRLFNI